MAWDRRRVEKEEQKLADVNPKLGFFANAGAPLRWRLRALALEWSKIGLNNARHVHVRFDLREKFLGLRALGAYGSLEKLLEVR